MPNTPETPRLYSDLAWLWLLWGGPEAYADYCRQVSRWCREQARIPVRSLLNIACGGGKNVFHLKREHAVTGLDLSPTMLDLARALNPDVAFVQGDMRSFELSRRFDAVLLDDGVAYMASRADLQATFASAWRHLHTGGVMVVTPDETRETFVQNRTLSTPVRGENDLDHVEVVFVENSYDPNPDDDHYEGTMVYLIRERGELRVETDRHRLGLFSIALWRETLTAVGFEVEETGYREDDRVYPTFVCRKSG